MARTVVAPDGRTWRIGRRYLSHRARFRSPRAKWLADAADYGTPFPVDAEGCLVVIAVVAVVAAAIFFVVPALVFAIELLVVLVIAAVAIVGRVVLRHPWVVEAAVPGTDVRRTWTVVGWRASDRLIETVANQLRAGGEPAPNVRWR